MFLKKLKRSLKTSKRGDFGEKVSSSQMQIKGGVHIDHLGIFYTYYRDVIPEKLGV